MMPAGAGFEDGAVAGMLDEHDVRFIGEIGLMAVGAGNARAAEAVFSGLLVLRSDRALPYIGLALAHQIKGDFDTAIRILSEDGLHASPGSEEILAFLGLALDNAGRPGASRKVMREMLACAGEESSATRLARNFLATVDGASSFVG